MGGSQVVSLLIERLIAWEDGSLAMYNALGWGSKGRIACHG